MQALLNKIKNDPRIESVWDEGEDGWWANLNTNFISDDTECGSLHEETLQELWQVIRYGAIRLRRPEDQGGESTDGGCFEPEYAPYVYAEERYLKLTAYQTCLLADRPEDCLEENLREQNPELNREQSWGVVNSVTRLFRISDDPRINGYSYLASTIDTYTLSLLQRSVLEDCFSGSTVCGQVSHLWDSPFATERALYQSAKRSVHIIADKFRRVGLESSFIPDF